MSPIAIALLSLLAALGWLGIGWLFVGLFRTRRVFQPLPGRERIGLDQTKEPPAGVLAPPRG
jgi:hypothetical protein